MADRYDIIVVGAGPAGSLYALLTARAGFRVLLLDREFFPRNRICNGILHPDAHRILKETGLWESFQKLPSSQITTVEFSAEDDGGVSAPLALAGYFESTVSRTLFDEWLRSEAEAAGADFLPGVSVRSFEGRKELITSEGDFEADLFIGADGRRSWMARASGLASHLGSCNRIAWQSILPEEVLEEGPVHIKFFQEGYFGVNRQGGGSANLCMLLNRHSFDTPQMIIDRYFEILPPLGWSSTYPVSRPINKAAENKVILIGDAARLLEPFTGEGITMALYTAQTAAHVTINSKMPDGTYRDLEKKYRKKHRALYQSMKVYNGLSRWLALSPYRGIFAAKVAKRLPFLLNYAARDFLPGQSLIKE